MYYYLYIYNTYYTVTIFDYHYCVLFFLVYI